ncbi:MAG TPA: phage antirepressor N-terminal domain-containing protein [Anaerolineales bacterium]|nr:phage antirepressor N-terminal domain-containing protein [Anaerolineales bacterium]
MKIIDQFPFEFYDHNFELYLTDNRQLILSLRSLCEAMGLDFSAQNRRVERDEALADGISMVVAPVMRKDGSSQEREVVCLTLRLLPYWLGTVDASRVKAELKDTIIRFKRELAEVAWAAFRSQILPPDMLAELDTALPPVEQEYHALMDQAAELKGQVGEHGSRINQLEDRMSALEARLVGTDFISHQQARQYLDAVGALGDLLKERSKKKASPFAVIHNEVKRQFQVPSYQLIPENEFDAVMEFLTKWWQREAPEVPVPEIFRVRQNRLL